jgi:hypothetical protein
MEGLTMGITKDDIDFANEVVNITPGSFLGGSYVVKGTEAGDIDVIVPLVSWEATRTHYGDRIQKVLRDIPVTEEAGVPDDERLVCVYRRGAVDIIVVADDYVEAYQKATIAIKADPVRFAERPARVAIHIFYADEVRVSKGLLTEAEQRKNRPAAYDADKKPSEAQP